MIRMKKKNENGLLADRDIPPRQPKNLQRAANGLKREREMTISNVDLQYINIEIWTLTTALEIVALMRL